MGDSRESKSGFVVRLVSLTLLVVFACATIYGTLEVRFPEVHQEFFLRVFTSLAAAAIAAIIPGVFEFETRMLASVIRASGALAVFALVYLHSPPPLSVGNEQMADLEGRWYYWSHITGTGLGYGSRDYGGEANFNIRSERQGTYLTFTGTLNWKVNLDKKELALLQAPIETWYADAAMSGPGKLIYSYLTTDGQRNVEGYGFFQVVRDTRGEIVELKGRFQRTGVDSPVYGYIEMYRRPLNYEGIAQQSGVTFKDLRQAVPIAAPLAQRQPVTRPSAGVSTLLSGATISARN